ncbi:MAG: N-acetyltransferase family protein [Methanomicrobiales archaeon]|nr:N-acetyltransferase family protein [Methanomicrobiales archaeon]
MAAVRIRPVKDGDRDQVISIFNHYVKESHAAFPDQPVEPGFFEFMRHGAHACYVAEERGKVVGFAILRPFMPFPAFSGTAAVTFFILPSHVRQGLGTRMMEVMIDDANRLGILTLVAQISSRNKGSIAFHGKQGFRECGRVPDAGMKFGEPFDLVLMRRVLPQKR